jgi:predicted Holliday junction resolvase-like endonuclease
LLKISIFFCGQDGLCPRSPHLCSPQKACVFLGTPVDFMRFEV